MRHYTTQSHRWVFIKQSDRPDHRNLRPFSVRTPKGLPSGLAPLRPSPRRPDPGAEATLLPKLEVHFAEFPDPLSPAVPEAANLGLLMRFSVRCRRPSRTFFNASRTPGNALGHPTGRRRSHSPTLFCRDRRDAPPLDGTENPAPKLRALVRRTLAPGRRRAGISACFPISRGSTPED